MKLRKPFVYLFVFVLILCLTYYVSAYYFGSEIKNSFTQKIARYNQASDQLNLKLVEYQQGIIKSEAKVSISYNDSNPILMKFVIIHQPVIYNSYTKTKPKGLYFFNVITQFTIMTEFLGQQTDFFHYTLLIDPKQDIKLNLTLDNISYVFYRLLGFNSNDVTYLDAYAEINLSEEGIDFEIIGQGKNLYSKDNLYQVAESQFSLNYNLYLSPFEQLGNIKKQYWKNKLQLNITAQNIVTNPESGYEMTLEKPKLMMEFDGELAQLLEILEGNNSLNDLLRIENNYHIAASLDNSKAQILTPYKDYIKLENLSTQIEIENNSSTRAAKGLFKLNNLNLKSITDNLSTNNIKFNFKMDVADELIDQFIELSDEYQSNLNDLAVMLFDKYNLVSINTSIGLDNLNGEGLILGKLTTDKLNFDFDLSKEKSKQDQIAGLKLLANKFFWQMGDANFKINIQDLNLNFDSSLNLTEYMDVITSSNDAMYDTNAKLVFNIPKFELFLPGFSFSADALQTNSDFRLNKDITGYLNNIFNIDKLQLKTDSLTVDIRSIQSKSAMQQVYKFMLAGINSVTTSSSNFKYKKNQLSINNLKYDSKSNLLNETLEYFNNLDIQALAINKNQMGDLSLRNRFYDINLKAYEELMVKLNLLSLNQADTQYLNSSEINNEFLGTIVHFLDKGLRIDNTLYMGFKNDRNIFDKAIKFYNKLALENKSQEIRKINDINDLITKTELIFNIDISKQYLEGLIKSINSQDIHNLYKNLQYVGVLKYKDDISKLEIKYKHPEILVNNHNLSYWQEQLKARNNREGYFKKLQNKKGGD